MVIDFSQERDMVEPVNNLLRMVFGEKIRGNLSSSDKCGFLEGRTLNIIGIKGNFPGIYQIIGEFLKEDGIKDGSRMSVISTYTGNAEIYAQSYKKRFGKKVEIDKNPYVNQRNSSDEAKTEPDYQFSPEF